MAKPMISMPRFPNFAILASVPASVTVLVMTLWADRLYSGMIRRADAVEVDAVEDAIDAVENDAELYSDVADRLERTEGDR